MKSLLILVQLSPIIVCALNAHDDVIDLSLKSLDSFKSAIAQHDVILVEFNICKYFSKLYWFEWSIILLIFSSLDLAPSWCHECKRFANEYSMAATRLKSSNTAVPLARVDCFDKQGEYICMEYKVSLFPTLLFFESGQIDRQYYGTRKADSIVKFMTSQIAALKNNVKSLSQKNYGRLVGKSDKDVLILYCKYSGRKCILFIAKSLVNLLQTRNGVFTVRNLSQFGKSWQKVSKTRMESLSLNMINQKTLPYQRILFSM